MIYLFFQVFDRMDNLVRHNKLHGANKRHQCDECDISYDFPSLLETHKEKHRAQTNSRRSEYHVLYCSKKI